jgi:hypothetical protein
LSEVQSTKPPSMQPSTSFLTKYVEYYFFTDKWNTIHENGAKFVHYFLKEKADVIRETAKADVRSVCGLGYPLSSKGLHSKCQRVYESTH